MEDAYYEKVKTDRNSIDINVILMQITYASTVTFADVSKGDYKICFKKVDYYINEYSQYLNVNVQKTDDYNLAIDIKNLYPGAYFTIRPHISNYGYKDVKIVEFELIYISGIKTYLII